MTDDKPMREIVADVARRAYWHPHPVTVTFDELHEPIRSSWLRVADKVLEHLKLTA